MMAPEHRRDEQSVTDRTWPSPKVLAALKRRRFPIAITSLGVVLLSVLLAGTMLSGPTDPAATPIVVAPGSTAPTRVLSSDVEQPVPTEVVGTESSATQVAMQWPPHAIPSKLVNGLDPDLAPAPGMIPKLAPPDGPTPDVGEYGVDPDAIRTEFLTHKVTLPASDDGKLVDLVNRHIARGDPDLNAWDAPIMADVKAAFPNLARSQRIDLTRCTAEYVERVIARNAGWVAPPDSDDHDVTVEGRQPQPR